MKRLSIVYSFFLLLSPLLADATNPLMRPMDVQSYRVSFTMDPAANPSEFPAEATITLITKAALTQIELDAVDLKISNVKSAGHSLKFATRENKFLTIQLGQKIPSGQKVTLSIQYTAQVRDAHYGLFRVTDPDDASRGTLYFTHLEPTNARTFLPCNDEPQDKALSSIWGKVPSGIQVLSNGEKTYEKATTVSGKPYMEFHWELKQPHPSYLIALAIGRFEKIHTKVGGKEISIWTGKNKLENSRYALEVTAKSYAFFEKYLGVKYPWPKYAIVTIPTFLWGGMENTSSTFQNQERTVLNESSSANEQKQITNLAAHELAHQWFGDYVTMQWWNDVWLNESFATLMGTLATEDVFQNEEARIESALDAWKDYFRQEDGPRSHPIVDKELKSIDDAFDSINYTKGENVLRMLEYYVGPSAFKKGVTAYLKKHAFKNATNSDFFTEMEAASKTSLKGFKDSWILSRGYPVIHYQGTWNPETKTYLLNLTQTPNHKEDKTVFNFKLPIVFHRKEAPTYSKEVSVSFSNPNETLSLKLDAEPDWVTVNPRSTVLAIWGPSQADELTLEKQALGDPDPLTRIWAVYTLLKPLREGTGSPSKTAEKVLLKVLEEDSSPYVRTALLETLQASKTRWLPTKTGNGILDLAKKALSEDFMRGKLFASDSHGWREYRSRLLAALGKVDHSQVYSFLRGVLINPTLPLDDLQKASVSMAMLGRDESAETLKDALKIHQGRGYRFRYNIEFAFGAFENPMAAKEIKRITSQYSSDYIGRIGNLVVDNQTLKNSKEWAEFLREFITKNTQFGDEVKARVLETIEDIKESHVKHTLEAILKDSNSDRMKELAKQILSKNFS